MKHLNHNSLDKRLVWSILGVLVILSIFIRLPMLFYGVPFDLGHEDENGFIGCALNYGATKSLEPILTWYPAFFTYILAAAFGVYYLFCLIFSDINSSIDFALEFLMYPGKFHLIGRLISLIFSICSVLLMYASGKHYRNQTTGLIAAIFFTFSTTVLVRTSWALPDATYVVLTILSLFLLIKYTNSAKLAHLLWSGFCCGLAIATKYNVGTLLLVGVSGIIYMSLAYSSNNATGFTRFLFTLIKSKALYLYGIFIIIGFFVGTPYFIFDIYTHLNSLGWEIGRLNQEAAGSSALLSQLPYLWIVSELFIWEQGVGLLVLAGLSCAIFQCFKGDKSHLILLPFIAISIAIVGRYNKHSLHYLLPVFPAIFITSAYGIEKAINKIANSKSLIVVLLIVAILFSASKLYNYSSYYAKQDTRVASREWILRNISEGSSVAIGRTTNAPPLSNANRFNRSQYSMISEQVMSNKLPKSLKEAYIQKISGRSYNVYNYIVKSSVGRQTSYQNMMADFKVLQLDHIIASKTPDYVILSSWDRPYLSMNGYQRLRDVPGYTDHLAHIKSFSPRKNNYAGPSIDIFKTLN